jgi:copper homeostasis protein (lipoprotein)
MTRRIATFALKGLIVLLPACASAPALDAPVTPLLNTYWQLSSLGSTAVPAGAAQREPHLSLKEQDHRVAGSLGCNAMNGSYTLDGGHLTFGPMISTRMACLKGMDIEHGFADALRNSASWKIAGSRLELYDAGGQLLAGFEARPTP